MEPKQNILSVPIAIIVAGLIIAGAIFFTRGGDLTSNGNTDNLPISKTEKDINLDLVADKDHLIGNPDALITIVEYSDLECPACKYFHPILSQVKDNYGKNGEIAWVFRHFPIAELHSKAAKEAEASECVAELGGNQKFWSFIDKIFEVTPANNGLDPKELPKIAVQLGLDETKFNQCLQSGKYAETVAKAYESGIKAGVNGTPTSFLILKSPLSKEGKEKLALKTVNYVSQMGEPLVVASSDGKIVSIGAAFPYAGMEEILNTILAEIK